MNNLRKASYNHLVAGIAVCLFFALGVSGIGYYLKLDYLVMPIVVTCIFSIFETIISTCLWHWVASNHSDSLPVFYTAVSGFRMLMSLFLLLIICLIVGRDAMAPYVVVFISNYIIMLFVHSRFFSKQVKNTL